MAIETFAAPVAVVSLSRQTLLVDEDKFPYAFIDFDVCDLPSYDRLSSVLEEFRHQKLGAADASEAHWLPYFDDGDRTEFWWASETELQQWNAFWFSTPLPERHSPQMPTPPWDFGSMIDSILGAEYDIVGVRNLESGQARLEVDPQAYPYGGIDALRALVRSFGHTITGFDDGTGFISGDPQAPRWTFA